MSSLKNIQSKMEQIEKLKKEIEEAKTEIHTTLGKKLITSLDLDYELLSSKKEIHTVVDKIVKNLPSDLFNDSNEIYFNKEDSYIHDDKEYSELNPELQNS
ncbi:hypothetical protein ACQKKE_02245 [Desemzia incerta]|uniref:hypothetical protein n=1 Tax=Desemzia incerta TaxID=82801 RepID=UPI003CFDF144